ncbi:MAG TPA: ribosomal protein S18-alanine N-acetyltransferase [Candidatus Krumholzibacterium sp.]|nr:ribosomal protein S18-alanine N-acetyltransferase [Candidatus Krumholzibacterium sp.]
MTETDIPRILEIERECFPTPWTETMFLCQLQLEEVSTNLVFVEKGRVLGYVIAWTGYEEVHILSIGVDPPERGRGIAEALLDASISETRHRGCRRVILEVRVGNERARRFYQKQGFRQIGIRKGYYAETGEDALVLEKDIV